MPDHTICRRLLTEIAVSGRLYTYTCIYVGTFDSGQFRSKNVKQAVQFVVVLL